MGSAVKLRHDYSAGELRRLARVSKYVSQSSRLLSIAAVLDGMKPMRRGSAAWTARRCVTEFTGSTRLELKVLSTNGRRDRRPGCHRSSRPNWLRSWRKARTVPLTVS